MHRISCPISKGIEIIRSKAQDVPVYILITLFITIFILLRYFSINYMIEEY